MRNLGLGIGKRGSSQLTDLDTREKPVNSGHHGQVSEERGRERKEAEDAEKRTPAKGKTRKNAQRETLSLNIRLKLKG